MAAYPSIGEIVRFCTTHSEPNGLGVYIKLLDYDGCEAFILGADYERHASRTLPISITDAVQQGEVLRVDSVHGYVDVKRRGVPQKAA